jgi:hypothetical protein
LCRAVWDADGVRDDVREYVVGTYEINVLWDPSPKGYRSRTNVPFGRPVRIPAPFDFDLDTSGFAVPEDESAADEQR